MGANELIEPVSVFFDTNHLIDLCRSRATSENQNIAHKQSYQNLADLMKTGYITPFVCYEQHLEFPKDRQQRDTIGNQLDALSNSWNMIAPTYITLTMEIYRYCHKCDSIVYFDKVNSYSWLRWLCDVSPAKKQEAELKKLDLHLEKDPVATMNFFLTTTKGIDYDNKRPEELLYKDLITGMGEYTNVHLSTYQRVVNLWNDKLGISPRIFPVNEAIGNFPIIQYMSSIFSSLRNDHTQSEQPRQVRDTDHMDLHWYPAHMICDYTLTDKAVRHKAHSIMPKLKARVYSDVKEFDDTLQRKLDGISPEN